MYTKEQRDSVLKYINDKPNYKLGFDLALGIYEFVVQKIEDELISLKFAIDTNKRLEITDDGRRYLKDTF